MATANEDGVTYQFSIHKPEGIWDDGQWGEAHEWDGIPAPFHTDALERLRVCIERNLPRVVALIA